MASGNYFSAFTHGGTQYSQVSQPTQQATTYAQHSAATAGAAGHIAYQTPAAAAHNPTYATATPARQTHTAAAAYDTSYTAAAASHQTTGQYSYAQRQDPVTQASATSQATYREPYSYAQSSTTSTYDKQSYYQQPQTQQHAASDTYYTQQSGKAKTGTAYGGTAASAYTAVAHQPAQKPVQQKSMVTYAYAVQTTAPAYVSTTTATYTKPTNVAQPQHKTYNSNRDVQQGQHKTYNNPNKGSNYGAASTTTPYDQAVYSAATNYYQQQQASKTGGNSWGFKGKAQFAQNKVKKDKPPPKAPQIHYCEVCKISCAGPQTYREHLEGQKHKKKENASKTGVAVPASRGSQQGLKCELCDVCCTGVDAYNAHIRGAKHQKVLKLHTKLGKPIPSTDPVKQAAAAAASASAAKPTTAGAGASAAAAKKPAVTVKKAATPKITFVGGSKLLSTPGSEKVEVKTTQIPPAASMPATPTTPEDTPSLMDFDKDVVPVGEDYIEEVKSDAGKVISFNCKLCECRFNDPNAKEMHMKGRRHRLQYKKKVDPSYVVDLKPSARSRKMQEEKMRRQMAKEEFMRQREEENRWRAEMRRYEEDMYWRRMEEEHYWEERRRYEEEMEFYEWQRRRGVPHPRPVPPKPPAALEMHMKRPDTQIDRHVMAKHNTIYPSEQELGGVQNMVSTVEKALRLVSDHIAEEDNPAGMETDAKEAEKKPAEIKTEPADGEKPEGTKNENQPPPRVLKGVMRVGVLAKGLLLKGERNMGLVVICTEKPTRTLLERVANNLPKQMQESDEKLDIKLCVEEASIVVTNQTEPQMTMKITLTSPIMRDQPETDTAKDPPDVLDRQKCLEALAALRHAKWFQARATGLQSCVIVIRVLRDLCERIPTWVPLNGWPMELLCERVIASTGQPLRPGDALRRVFEAIAGGLLLPGGPGLYDPCEREATDALSHLTPQQREDITASAQHALRLIVFRQIHKVLGMEPLYTQARNLGRRGNRNRKRRRDGDDADGDDAEGKKDKKEDGSEMETDGVQAGSK
ncbi:zinc finger RNA-binding protein-like isoform X4 [Amphiura filiformis]|uniref:zinc finger RNA-binding protein-like isoform X3 n=1 Tax=Amphiura filiformis TaxID=82378 RepID=UPI003B226D3C